MHDHLAEEAARWRSARRAAAFTNREFVAAVRAELSAAGRPDIPFERRWIDEDEPGERLLIHVPVGSETTVPLRVMERYFHMQTAEDLKRNATEFAKALINLKLAEKMLLKYLRDIQRAAIKVISAARADGLDVLLDGVGFKPTYAYHLTGASWREAAYHLLATVTVRHTSFDLRPTTSTVWVEEPSQVAEELLDILEDQLARQELAYALDARGADLLVDPITLDLLEAHGLDACEILTKVWKEQHVSRTVSHRGGEASISLNSGDGEVHTSIELPEGYWNGERLWLYGNESDVDHRQLVGRSLGDLVPHPVFTARPIVSIERRPIDHFSFDLSDKFLFDADTGRLWRDEEMAAQRQTPASAVQRGRPAATPPSTSAAALPSALETQPLGVAAI